MEAGSLGFSITIFTITAVLSLALLVIRRWGHFSILLANFSLGKKEGESDTIFSTQMFRCMWPWRVRRTSGNSLRFSYLSRDPVDGLRDSLISRDIRAHKKLLIQSIPKGHDKLYNTASIESTHHSQTPHSICIRDDRFIKRCVPYKINRKNDQLSIAEAVAVGQRRRIPLLAMMTG